MEEDAAPARTAGSRQRLREPTDFYYPGAQERSQRERQWYELSPRLTTLIISVAIGIGILAAALNDGNNGTGGNGGNNGGGNNGHHEKHRQLCDWNEPRLPRQWYEAVEYAWHTEPEFETPFHMTGSVDAHLKISNTTQCVVMNSRGLTNLQGKYKMMGTQGSSSLKSVKSITQVSKHDQIIIELDEAVEADTELMISIDFDGKLSRDMNGLYVSTYVEEGSGKEMHMVSTQFEATYARQAFPCLDEPEFKAKFTVSIGNIPNGFTALSNMPVQEKKNGGETVIFEKSVPMSTYLVAVAVGKLESVKTTVNVGLSGNPQYVDLAVWGTYGKNAEDSLRYALDVAADILPFYSNYFRIPFPLPKTDLIAIPDFAAGAMENWGLITFRETALLANNRTSSLSSLQRVAVVVSHELAHQWFGNLVTMEWWNELWLNEGFATFMEYRGVEHFDPGFQILRTFLTDVQRAMGSDAFAHSHALTRENVETSGEIEEMFDAISYSKGASVITMLADYADKKKSESFNDGLHDYLTDHKYGNAVSNDLWKAIGSSAGDPNLSEKMDDYTHQAGYALVVVAWSDQTGWDTGAGNLKLCQMRPFRSSYSRSIASESDRDALWWIPLSWVTHMQTGNPTTPNSAFEQRCLSETVSMDVSSDVWIKFNPKQTGYYRVIYPVNLYEQFLQFILAERESGIAPGSQQLPADDRAGILDDLLGVTFMNEGAPVDAVSKNQYFPSTGGSVAEASGVNVSYAFHFMKSVIRNETEFAPWSTALGYIYSLDQKLFAKTASDCYDNYKEEIRELLRPAVTAFDWNDQPGGSSDPLRVQLRNMLFEAASYFGYQPIIDEAKDAFRGGRQNISSNLVSLVYRTVVRSGGDQEYEEMKAIYEQTTDPTLRNYALMALTESREESKLSALLDYALDDTNVRRQDFPSVLAGVARNPYGRTAAWQFYTDSNNFATIMDRYGHGGFALGKIVSSTASRFTTSSEFNQVKTFYENNELEAATLEVAQALESIKANIQFVDTQKSLICDVLTG